VNEGDVGLTGFVSMAGGTAYVVAFEEGTVVYVNGLPEGSINAGERLSLSLSAGDIVSANKPIMLHSTSERHVPITWKSTKFVIPFYRADPQIIYIFAPDADASVSIFIGPSSSPSTTVSVAKGTVKTVSLNVSPPKAVILESNAPILVAVASNNGSYDIRFIHPPEKELIGIPSTDFYVAALEDNTVIEWHQKDKSGTYKLNRGEMVRHAELGISSGGQYNAWPVRVIANKPVMIGSFADGDGCDATCGLPPRALPTKMVLPVNAQWLSIAAPYPDTIIRIYYQGVLKYESTVSSLDNPLAPGLLYLKPENIDSGWSNIPYGTVIEADKPIYVVFDCAEAWLDDETVLLGINRRMWRLYKNPVLTLDVESLAVKGSLTPLTGVLKAEGKLDCDALRIKGTEVIDALRNVKNLNSIQMGQIHIERTNEINNYDGPVYLQYRTGKGVVIGGASNSFIDLRGGFYIKGTQVLTANRELKNVSADAGIITSGVFALDRIPTIPASKAHPDFGTTGDRILVSSDTMYETTSTSYQLAWSVEIEALEDVKNVIEYVKAQIRVGPSSGGGSPPPPDSETYCPT